MAALGQQRKLGRRRVPGGPEGFSDEDSGFFRTERDASVSQEPIELWFQQHLGELGGKGTGPALGRGFKRNDPQECLLFSPNDFK